MRYGGAAAAFLLIITIITAGCSPYQVVRAARVVASGDPAAVGRYAAERAAGYAVNPAALRRDIELFKKLLDGLRRAAGGEWGAEEAKAPQPKEYVKYTNNYQSRAVVDFDKGLITVETLDQDQPRASLRTAVVTILLTPHDPRAVDLFSSEPVEIGPEPFLLGEVKDHEGRDIRWEWRAGRYADHLIENNLQTRNIRVEGRERTVCYVSFDMVADHVSVRAAKYLPLVREYAGRFDVSGNLIMAVIKTESNFNPFAVSSAGAFGLMQVVPSSAGRDVHRFLNGRDETPGRDFLFAPENNIQYGTAYLHLLQYRYLKSIENPVSREYCAIAAYNTGSGNVFKAFGVRPAAAPQKINDLSPLDVYTTLRANLPYQETRRYLVKVLDAKKNFVNM